MMTSSSASVLVFTPLRLHYDALEFLMCRLREIADDPERQHEYSYLDYALRVISSVGPPSDDSESRAGPKRELEDAFRDQLSLAATPPPASARERDPPSPGTELFSRAEQRNLLPRPSKRGRLEFPDDPPSPPPAVELCAICNEASHLTRDCQNISGGCFDLSRLELPLLEIDTATDEPLFDGRCDLCGEIRLVWPDPELQQYYCSDCLQ